MNHTTQDYLIELSKKYPNHGELGGKVRRLYKSVTINNIEYNCKDYPNDYDLGEFIFSKLVELK